MNSNTAHHSPTSVTVHHGVDIYQDLINITKKYDLLNKELCVPEALPLFRTGSFMMILPLPKAQNSFKVDPKTLMERYHMCLATNFNLRQYFTHVFVKS